MNLQALMKQAQSIQKDMMKAKNEIDEMVFYGESSLVKVEINGKKEVLKVSINKEQEISTDDIEILEDMIVVAVNDALRKIDEETEKKLGKYTSAMPGLF